MYDNKMQSTRLLKASSLDIACSKYLLNIYYAWGLMWEASRDTEIKVIKKSQFWPVSKDQQTSTQASSLIDLYIHHPWPTEIKI